MANDGFVVPNAPDAFVFDQAEPDSLDFLVVGNRRSGVVEGGVVTTNNGSSVNVSTVSVVSQGIAGTVTGTAVAVPAADPANARFDVIIVRRDPTTNAFSLLSLSGPTNLTTNPRFPAVGTLADQFNPLTDVLLAALYREPGTAVQGQHIVDKRVFYGTVITRKGAATPPDSLGREGEVYYWTGTRKRGQSAFFIKDATGWQNLMVFDPSIFVPVGTVITYAGKSGRAPDPEFYMECLGQYVSMAAYPELYDVVGDAWGVSGGEFRLPPIGDRYIRGAATAGPGGGRASVKLTSNNLPQVPLSGTTGNSSPSTSTDVRGPLGHTVGGVTQNHGHLMEHTHLSMLFAYPYGGPFPDDPQLGGVARSYYHLDETLCNGTHARPGIHVGVIGSRWNAAQHNLDAAWEDYIARETKEFTAGIHAGVIPAQPAPGVVGEYTSGDHAHPVGDHPAYSHAHTVNSHSHTVNLGNIGKLDPDAIDLNPPYVAMRHFIKYR